MACGWYLPGKIGMKSLMGLPKAIIAGDNLMAGSGVFLSIGGLLIAQHLHRVHHWGSVVGEDSFHDLDTYFSPTVAEWEGDG